MSREPQATEAGKRILLAAEMADAGVTMMRESLKRRFPDESEEQITARLHQWLLTRPGAEFGDGPGVPTSWPRSRK